MKRIILSLGILWGTTAFATTIICGPGTHVSCHAIGGRGGGYRSLCKCLPDPPPACVTLTGVSVPVEQSLILFDVNSVDDASTDTCDAHAFWAQCQADLTFTPANGYTTCYRLPYPLF